MDGLSGSYSEKETTLNRVWGNLLKDWLGKHYEYDQRGNLLAKSENGKDADNGAALWGTHPSQIKQTGHPGRGCSAYHDWNVHSPHSDQRIMKLLQRAEPDGEIAVRATLKAIGTKMEQGRWKTPIDCKTGKYKQP